ncbi:MAG: NAD(P)H-dependent oxidoreductase subunit E [Dehalococcoidales bacterium]|nr:NAD(P)H-dependent oxidoreductase subunit E [Dehalococcoidales bacterium]
MKLNQRQLKSKIKNILGHNTNDRGMLVSILQDTQTEFGYLSRDAITEISKQLDIPLSQVYSVATFFKAFSLIPRGRHQIQVCLGTACHVRGAEKILDTVERELGIRPGENDKGLKFSLETVNCVGACALGPIVIVDGKYSGEMKIETVKPLLEGCK